MRIRMLWLILLMCAPVLFAQEEQPAPAEEEAEPETGGDRLRALFKDIDDVIGSVEITETDVDAFIEHLDSFTKAMQEDESFGELEGSSFKDAFEHAIETSVFKDWESGLGVNGRDWLRKAYRIRTLITRLTMAEAIEEGRAGVRASRERLAKSRDLLPEGQYEETVAGLDETEATLDELSTASEELPAPGEDEQKVLEVREDDIVEALGG